jgi:DNA polymerase-4
VADWNTDGTWRYLLHADLDAFYASVEQMDDPRLRGKPVVVGGPPESRGVVAAASYEARKFGIHSAMPMKTALQISPLVIRVNARFDRYRELSRTVMEVFSDVTPTIESLSLDEAFLDVSDVVDNFAEARSIANGIKSRIRSETGLVVTTGGGVSKTVAKVASQVAKPDGLLIVPPGAERAFLAPLDINFISGIGPKTADLLRANQINKIGDLASRDDLILRRIVGNRGPDLKRRALGIDNSRVSNDRQRKSVSSETTFARDVEDVDILRSKLDDLAQEITSYLQRRELKGRTVRVKLRLADFTTFTRQGTLDSPTDDLRVIQAVARRLLNAELAPGREFRLIGVGVTNFQEVVQLPLLPG